MLDSKTKLVQLIDAFLAGGMGFPAFQEAYSKHFIDEMPDDALSPDELGLFGEVHEKAEWTAPKPPKDDRAHGWMDIGEFREWLRNRRQALRA
jgi:hypothetical protein